MASAPGAVLEGAARRRAVNAWVMYDWANSAFATTTMAAVLPVFFSAVAAKGILTPVSLILSRVNEDEGVRVARASDAQVAQQ